MSSSRPSRNLALLLVATVLVIWGAAPAGATWFYAATSIFQSKAASEDHPETLSQMLVMPNEAVRPLVCVAYSNTLGKGKGGRVDTAVRITTPETTDIFGLPVDPVVREMALSGKVTGNSRLDCKVAPDMFAGDIVEFDHLFVGMPKVKSGDGELVFVEMSGVVSDAGEPTLWNAPNGFRLPEGHSPNGVVPGAKDGWHHAVNSVFQAESNEQKHPKKTAQTMVVPEAAKKPSICAGYSNMAPNKGKGKLITTATVSRADGSVETIKLSSGVRKNAAMSCKKTGAIEPGDFVDFAFTFKGMPKLGRYQQTIEFADVTGVVTTAGEPDHRSASPPGPAPLPDPNPPPDPSTPSSPSTPSTPSSPTPSSPSPAPTAPGGPLSSADYSAAAKLLKNNTGTQLWRPKGDNPGKWVAVGPGTRAISGNKLDYNTAGFGSTIASAVADFERKMGSLGSGGSLSSGEQSALQWYSSMSSAGGATSVRRDGGGGYHGEYFRPSHGVQHHGPLSSMQAALDWLKSRGI